MTKRLTVQQLEIIKHLCNGLSMKEASEEMNYSLSSLNTVLATARKCMGARTTVHLVAMSIAEGFIEYEPDVDEEPATVELGRAAG